MTMTEGFVPKVFGKNQRGMQSTETLDEYSQALALDVWMSAKDAATKWAGALDELGLHKQQANRILEPFVYVRGVMSGTEWDNFFQLRAHPEADPEFEVLASMMKEQYNANTPQTTHYHLPYVSMEEKSILDMDTAYRVSSSRCARISYRTFDGNRSTVEDDLQLYEKLVSSKHLSPYDHPAITDGMTKDEKTGMWSWQNPEAHRHNWGWIPYRVKVERILGMECRRDSYEAFSFEEPVSD
jgi:hypothetical protein